MQQERLFRLAVEAINVQVTFVPGEGWSMRAGWRRQDECWSDAQRVEYSHLTTPELVDVIDAELGRALGML